MSLIVWGIVGGVNDHVALWIRVCADDWAAEIAIKASNEVNSLENAGVSIWHVTNQ